MDAYDGLDRNFIAEIGGNPFNMTAAGLRLSKSPMQFQLCMEERQMKCGRMSIIEVIL